jgi:1,4-dihydroxy-2-naphthoate octaprenyltransferase
MSSIKTWIEAARLRTLPLSLASIIAGGALAREAGEFRLDVFLLALLVAAFLQILANFANDYGDFVKGTDSQHRVGPTRTLQSGALSLRQMQIGIAVVVGLCSLSGVPLIIIGRGSLFTGSGWIFALLGLAAIGAALAYTMGHRPYGYSGLGDSFVFLFFGPVAVLGTKYLMWSHWAVEDFLLALGFGLLSVGVLNINNMRDRENDAASGKHTLPVRLGPRWAKVYHGVILGIGLMTILAYGALVSFGQNIWGLAGLWVISLGLAGQQSGIFKTEPMAMDPYLKKLSLGSLVLAAYLFVWLG